jgi:hypothetical protein
MNLIPNRALLVSKLGHGRASPTQYTPTPVLERRLKNKEMKITDISACKYCIERVVERSWNSPSRLSYIALHAVPSHTLHDHTTCCNLSFLPKPNSSFHQYPIPSLQACLLRATLTGGAGKPKGTLHVHNVPRRYAPRHAQHLNKSTPLQSGTCHTIHFKAGCLIWSTLRKRCNGGVRPEFAASIA